MVSVKQNNQAAALVNKICRNHPCSAWLKQLVADGLTPAKM